MLSLLEAERDVRLRRRCVNVRQGALGTGLLVTTDHRPPAENRALRPTWVIPEDDGLPSSSQLRNPFIASSGVNVRPAYQSAVPYPMRPSALHNPAAAMRTLSDMQHHQALDRVHHYQHSRTATGGPSSSANNNSQIEEREQEQQHQVAEQSMTRLWENFLNASNLGQSSSDWRLALPTLATSLTLHLIDGEFEGLAGPGMLSGLP